MNKLTEKYTMWVARDKNGTLWQFRSCPEKTLDAFVPPFYDFYSGSLPDNLFDYITWENSPQLVEFTATPVNLCK